MTKSKTPITDKMARDHWLSTVTASKIRAMERRMRRAEAQVRAVRVACRFMADSPGETMPLVGTAQNITAIIDHAGRRTR